MFMKTDLQTITKGSLSFIDYVEKKRFIADALAESLHPVSFEDLIGYILGEMDSSYGTFIIAYMVKDDQTTVDDLLCIFFQEEARLEHDHLR